MINKIVLIVGTVVKITDVSLENVTVVEPGDRRDSIDVENSGGTLHNVQIGAGRDPPSLENSQFPTQNVTTIDIDDGASRPVPSERVNHASGQLSTVSAMNVLVTVPEGNLRESLFPPARRERLESMGSVTWNPASEQFTAAELRSEVRDVDVCVTGWGTAKIDERVLRDADALDLVAHIGGSVASVGSHDLYDRGVTVCNANDVMAKYVAEAIVGYALAWLRRIPQFDATLKAGGWKDGFADVASLFESTVGFVGLGDVGRNLAKLLAPFDVDILVYDPYVTDEELAAYDAVREADLQTVLAASEVVSIHAPKTEETLHMFDADRLAQLSDGSLLINAARGAIVDEAALLAELRTGRIAAVLDVFEKEPLSEDSDLRTVDNAILQPHVAAAPARVHLTDAILDELARYADDRPLKRTVSRERFAGMTNDQLQADDEA